MAEPGTTFINGAWRPPTILDGRYRLCENDDCPGWMMNRDEGVHYHPIEGEPDDSSDANRRR